MDTAIENRFTVERYSDESRWIETFKPTREEAKSWIGGVQHWRITDRHTDIVEKSAGELPEIFDRNVNANTLTETAHLSINVRTETQTGHIPKFKAPRGN